MKPKISQGRLLSMASLAFLAALMPSTIRAFSTTASSSRSRVPYMTRSSIVHSHLHTTSQLMSTKSEMNEDGSSQNPFVKGNKGKILVLGGSGKIHLLSGL